LVGDNNVGKSTILEAIDLTLRPDRLSRMPVIDEHDFYAGEYADGNNNAIFKETQFSIIDILQTVFYSFSDFYCYFCGNNSEYQVTDEYNLEQHKNI
jgi:putative ATP-dependent endonuclease of OLD family